MKVAILVKEFPPDVIGGTETQTMRMAEEVERRTDHEVTVYTKSYPGRDQHNYGFDLVRVPNWRLSPFVSTLTFALVVFIYLFRDRDRIDVLQCMMIYPSGFVGYVLAKLGGVPYFAWIRGGDYYFMKEHPVKRWMIRQVLRDTVVLVQTRKVKTDVKTEFPDSTIRVLGNGVSVPNDTADGDEIVFIGRLKEQKGVSVLLRAVAGTDERVLIVGDGPERERLRQLANELGVNASFVGEVPPDEVTDYLRRAKVFVLPSVRGEGLPNAILEAMAMGVPVVSTDTGGIRDIIEEDETGYLVDPGDVDELRARLTELQDEELREAMGKRARNHVVEHRSWRRLIEALNEFYQNITANPEGPE